MPDRLTPALVLCLGIGLLAVGPAAPQSTEGAVESCTLPLAAETVEELPAVMAELAERLLAEAARERGSAGEATDDASDGTFGPEVRLRLQVIAGRWSEALATIRELRAARRAEGVDDADLAAVPTEIHARARRRAAAGDIGFEAAFGDAFRRTFRELDDRTALEVTGRLRYSLPLARRQLAEVLEARNADGRIGCAAALRLARHYHLYLVYQDILPLAGELVAEDDARRYAIRDDVLVGTPDGAVLSVTVVRPRRLATPQPAALHFTIYAEPAADFRMAKLAAAHGYVGVTANSRGKGRSPDRVVPYEHEVTDTRAVLDWIVERPWSDGRVAMWGGSYAGFAAWAAAKVPHPALAALAPWAAAVPGLGLPMHNNVFLNANYCWAFLVTSGQGLDDAACRDPARWERMEERWYRSGRPYREIDRVDGTPNPWLQRWLGHPAYDAYWQAMVPYADDFTAIDVPVLTITGYFDDGQVSALQYLREHLRHRPEARHYLVVGPWDHQTTQWGARPTLRGYRLDASATIDPPELTFRWLDHVLRGGPRPKLLEDRINYQVMGADRWRHVPSLAAMATDTLRLYLSSERPVDVPGDIVRGEAGSEAREAGKGAEPGSGRGPRIHVLAAGPPSGPGVLRETVDFTDRSTTSYADYYPWPIVREELQTGDALVFVSDPFEAPVEVAGSFGGRLRATASRRDMDVMVTLYERTPAGRYFHLSYWLGRASYAHDMSERRLLEPGEPATIPIRRSYLTARRLRPGSRLVAVLDVNRGPWAQVNYGSGGEVAGESVDDAGEPLRVDWHTDSFLTVPVRQLRK